MLLTAEICQIFQKFSFPFRICVGHERQLLQRGLVVEPVGLLA